MGTGKHKDKADLSRQWLTGPPQSYQGVNSPHHSLQFVFTSNQLLQSEHTMSWFYLTTVFHVNQSSLGSFSSPKQGTVWSIHTARMILSVYVWVGEWGGKKKGKLKVRSIMKARRGAQCSLPSSLILPWAAEGLLAASWKCAAAGRCPAWGGHQRDWQGEAQLVRQSLFFFPQGSRRARNRKKFDGNHLLHLWRAKKLCLLTRHFPV